MALPPFLLDYTASPRPVDHPELSPRVSPYHVSLLVPQPIAHTMRVVLGRPLCSANGCLFFCLALVRDTVQSFDDTTSVTNSPPSYDATFMSALSFYFAFVALSPLAITPLLLYAHCQFLRCYFPSSGVLQPPQQLSWISRFHVIFDDELEADHHIEENEMEGPDLREDDEDDSPAVCNES
ncbi:uncharacterized protein EDB93DRAFT_1255428 [Suillus bovinus]|uniref:uncharacterized protein n=1 Tax=Suillus bovinus TaxID=48563 RepID=UPI001B863882|nr:uncharacterized protein EDB93DRAFT_1255428 [Suillus bovinus]KAG2131732.1 hypothetical protein EDB93DRAFT_1255428 [Suillus bovinus]